jgi:hypothetical protein
MERSPQAFLQELAQLNDYTDAKLVRDATRYAAITRKMFTHAIITGRIGDYWGLGDCWCYPSYAAARSALAAWDGEGEPEGWLRHPGPGRRVSQSADERDEQGRKVGAPGVRYVRP